MAAKKSKEQLTTWSLNLSDPGAAGALEFYISGRRRAGDDESAYAAEPYLEAARAAAREPEEADSESEADTPASEG